MGFFVSDMIYFFLYGSEAKIAKENLKNGSIRGQEVKVKNLKHASESGALVLDDHAHDVCIDHEFNLCQSGFRVVRDCYGLSRDPLGDLVWDYDFDSLTWQPMKH